MSCALPTGCKNIFLMAAPSLLRLAGSGFWGAKKQKKKAPSPQRRAGGGSKRSTPFTKADWENAVNWIINTYVSTRTNVVLGQLRNKGWFPSLAAPTFNRSSGKVEKGFQLEIENQGGVVFYTLD